MRAQTLANASENALTVSPGLSASGLAQLVSVPVQWLESPPIFDFSVPVRNPRWRAWEAHETWG